MWPKPSNSCRFSVAFRTADLQMDREGFNHQSMYYVLTRGEMVMFRAFYQSAQFINWPAQSRNYRLGAQFINRVRNLEIESRASNERSVHVLYIA